MSLFAGQRELSMDGKRWRPCQAYSNGSSSPAVDFPTPLTEVVSHSVYTSLNLAQTRRRVARFKEQTLSSTDMSRHHVLMALWTVHGLDVKQTTYGQRPTFTMKFARFGSELRLHDTLVTQRWSIIPYRCQATPGCQTVTKRQHLPQHETRCRATARQINEDAARIRSQNAELSAARRRIRELEAEKVAGPPSPLAAEKEPTDVKPDVSPVRSSLVLALSLAFTDSHMFV